MTIFDIRNGFAYDESLFEILLKLTVWKLAIGWGDEGTSM